MIIRIKRKGIHLLLLVVEKYRVNSVSLIGRESAVSWWNNNNDKKGTVTIKKSQIKK